MDPGTSHDELLIERTDEEFRSAYALGQSIGAGGAGEVFLATQVSLARQVVIKVMQRALVADDTHRRRFHREARMLSRLSHPRITQVYEYGVWAGQPYLVMEYVDGGSLASLMESQPRVATPEALRIALHTAEGLDYLHQNKILHRDIKPGNILLTADRDAKIADFGLARPEGDQQLTQQGMVVGTLWYIAPEVLVSEDASPRSDLFSLGMVTYQMLSGRMPFREDVSDVVQLASMRVNETPLGLQVHRPDLPAEILGVVNRLLSSDPAARHQSAAELVEELTELHDAISTASRKIKRLPARRPASAGHSAMRTEHISIRDTRPVVVESESAPTVLRGVSTVKRIALLALPPGRARVWAAAVLLCLVPLGIAAGVLAFRHRARPSIDADPAVAGAGTPLTITRSPRWVKARMVTVAPAKLVVRATPVGGMTGQAVEAASRDLHEHEVEVEPLSPRVTYQLEARLVMADGSEQKLGTRIAESPVESLFGLSRDVERLKLLTRLEAYDKSRGLKQPPVMKDVYALVEPARLTARIDALAPFIEETYADDSLSASDRLAIYRGLEELRYLDRYCEAHRLEYRSGVEKLLPPDLKWSFDPFAWPEPVRARALGSLVEGQMAQPVMANDDASQLLVDFGDWADVRHRRGGQRAPETIEKQFVVPVAKVRRAQLKLVVRNVRSAAFTVSADVLPEPLAFVAPYAKGISGDTVTLYHTIPAEWVKPGPWKLTIRARVVPGAYRNARPLPIVAAVDSLKNYPLFEEIALLASE